MKTLPRLFALILFASVIGCKSPLDKEFDRETAEVDFARIVRMEKVDSADAYIMSHFMVEHDLIGSQILELDATYRDILEESKEYWKKNHKDASDSTSENPLSEQGQNKFEKDLRVSITAVDGSVQKSEWSHGIKYHLVIENISGKGLKAIKGNFAFYDPFGEKIQDIEYKYLDAMATGEKIERDLTLRIQNAITSQKLMEYGNTNPFTVKWEPLNVLYQ